LGQQLRMMIQKVRSAAESLVHGLFALKMASRWRRAKISMADSVLDRNKAAME
jgi:hypothetical protein